jgi:hypothetical protein
MAEENRVSLDGIKNLEETGIGKAYTISINFLKK